MRFRRKQKQFEFKKIKEKSKNLIMAYASEYFVENYKCIVADGAIRSSKTFSLVLSQVLYVNQTEEYSLNLWGGVTDGAIEENYVIPMKRVLEELGFHFNQNGSIIEIYLKKEDEVTKELGLRVGIANYYEIKGGNDVKSEGKIQGRTYYTVLIDEFPKCHPQFIKQAIGRTISYGRDGKIFLSGNPEGSEKHWAFREYIGNPKMNTFRKHFELEDNGSLTDEQIEEAKTLYAGVFYKRMILGLWVAAEGLIYDCVTEENYLTYEEVPHAAMDVYMSLDYGNSNAFSCGLWVKQRYKKQAYRIDEYYYNAKEKGKKKSADQYVKELIKFISMYDLEPWQVEGVVIDPSAPIKVELEEAGFNVINANNNVNEGIELHYKLLATNKIMVVKKRCKNWCEEIELYAWDEKASSKGEDKVIKMFDHSQDESRYFANTIMRD